MASKRKDAVALFEAISKTRPKADGNMNVPAWMLKHAQAGAEGQPGEAAASEAAASEPAGAEQGQQNVAAEAPADVPAAPQAQAVAPGESAPQAAPGEAGEPRRRWKFPDIRRHLMPAAAVSAGPKQPLVAVANRRIALSLDYVTAGIAGAMLVALLAVTFVLGRVSVSKTPPPPADAAKNVPLKPDVARTHGPTRTGGATPAGAAASGAAARVDGKYYLIVQTLFGPADKQQADGQKIVEFLRRNGEEADVRPTNRGDYVVLSFRTMDSSQSAEAKDFAKKIEELGKKYKAEGGQYDFRQTKQGKTEPFYYKYKQ